MTDNYEGNNEEVEKDKQTTVFDKDNEKMAAAPSEKTKSVFDKVC